jgi:hypothetical protein
MHFTDEAWAHMTHEGKPNARRVRLVRERSLSHYGRSVRDERLALAHQSVRNPELRERMQLFCMRGGLEAIVPGVAASAASERYYDKTHGGDWPEDH